MDNIRLEINRLLAAEFGENQVSIIAAPPYSKWRYQLIFTGGDALPLAVIDKAREIIAQVEDIHWIEDKLHLR